MLGGLSQGRVQVGFSGDEFEGEAQVDGAKRPRTEGEAREEAGRGLGWGLGEPLPRFFFQIYHLKSCNLVYS